MSIYRKRKFLLTAMNDCHRMTNRENDAATTSTRMETNSKIFKSLDNALHMCYMVAITPNQVRRVGVVCTAYASRML